MNQIDCFTKMQYKHIEPYVHPECIPKKRITLFFSEDEFSALEQTCQYIQSTARPFIKATLLQEIERLLEQQQRDS